MEALITSTLLVARAEIGDNTRLLSFVRATSATGAIRLTDDK